MAFMDQIFGGGAVQTPGRIGPSVRPKQRYLDQVLMKNRDEKESEAEKTLGLLQEAYSGGANPVPFGGGQPIPSPSFLGGLK